ncbi:plasmid pRiA4b ORF-3 family protein [Micromonospora sp. NBC_00898]|uniref:plasmid pRiA4b ORF-3 family protein n=1 Tax=Micromonospora sp. NBC_00898 TaxID=2975981 RepID=UPI00386AEAEA|nr:plasmid pRiA4b ORF-3 family protein [Micromonospora sp. NBC_00898]
MDPQPLAVEAPVDVAGAGRLARGCMMADQACELARWVGRDGRPVTASRVLRRADVAAAGAVLGVPVPARVRTAADVPVLHRPWSFALGSGLLKITGSVAVAGPVLEQWPSLGDAEVLDAWLAGFRAVCTVESDPRYEQGVATLAFAFLEVVATRDCLDPRHLWHWLVEVVEEQEEDGDRSDHVPFHVLTQYVDSVTGDRFAGMVDLLGRLGAVTGTSTRTVAVTGLGQWARACARADRPRRITADLPANEVVELLADCVRRGVDPWSAAWRWLEPRPAADAARELLTAAAGVSAAARIGAGDVADGLGEQALGVWREAERIPELGPHARATLAAWDGEGPRLAPVDARWLAVEHAAASLEGPGPDEALALVYDRIPGTDLQSRLDAVAGCDHPDAGRVAAALTAFVSSGVARSVDQVYQLKVVLMRWSPSIWRRVLVPAIATFGDLHAVIQELFGWDGDHLHMFEVGGKRYSDPLFDLRDSEMADEFEIRLRDVFTGATKKVRYEYDFGASWWHEVTLEKVHECGPEAAYPICIAFAGDSPVEYPSEEEPQDPEPFELVATNRRLARIGQPVEPDDQDQ